MVSRMFFSSSSFFHLAHMTQPALIQYYRMCPSDLYLTVSFLSPVMANWSLWCLNARWEHRQSVMDTVRFYRNRSSTNNAYKHITACLTLICKNDKVAQWMQSKSYRSTLSPFFSVYVSVCNYKIISNYSISQTCSQMKVSPITCISDWSLQPILFRLCFEYCLLNFLLWCKVQTADSNKICDHNLWISSQQKKKHLKPQNSVESS